MAARILEIRSLLVAALTLADPPLHRMSTERLELLIRTARRGRVLGRLQALAEDQGHLEQVDPHAAEHLRAARVYADHQRRRALWELDRIQWSAGDALGTVVALKGCGYALAGLQIANGRAFADVDLLLTRDGLQHTEQVLTARGWVLQKQSEYDQRYYREWSHEIPPLRHRERDVEVDLHHNILPPTSRLKPDAALLLGASRPVHGSRFRVLGPADMVLHSMVHLFYNEDLSGGLRELVDQDFLMRHFATAEPGFWEGFWQRAVDLDLARPAFYGLRYNRRIMGTPVPESVSRASRQGAPDVVTLWLMDRLVPLAAFPDDPDGTGRVQAIARWLLYVRSHWLRMPLRILVPHLTRKASQRLLNG